MLTPQDQHKEMRWNLGPCGREPKCAKSIPVKLQTATIHDAHRLGDQTVNTKKVLHESLINNTCI